MAKIKGPLFSIDARGNIAKGGMQFRGGLQGVHAYRPVPPGQYTAGPTQAQLDHRALYGQAVEAWRALTPEERDAWNQQAAGQGVSGWNHFLTHYIAAASESGPYEPPASDQVDFDLSSNAYTPPAANNVDMEL